MAGTETVPLRLRAQQPAFSGAPVSNIVRILLAIFLPPVAVLTKVGFGKQFWINIVLTICGILPGMIHAVWVIGRYDRPRY
jgi:uncharacterized membrane protein YqaE (UPF0057 family)